MAAPTVNMLGVTLRGSQGIWRAEGPPKCQYDDNYPSVNTQRCRIMCFSQDGSLFAYCDGTSTVVLDTATNKTVLDLPRPKTVGVHFSPRNTLLVTWEPFTTAMNQAEGPNACNLHIWNVQTGQIVRAANHKKQEGWYPQWTSDETLAARIVNNEVLFHENNKFDVTANKLHLQKIHSFLIPQKAKEGPYHIATYIPGSKGAASMCRIYRYPHFSGSTVATKSFFKADKVDMEWSPSGHAMLILTATEFSSDSYYGEQGLHYMDIKGESCLIPRSKNGPVYCVEWSPKNNEFCVVYGFMPAKATLFNSKCEPVFDFGTGPRNTVYFNPFGNIMTLAGFGNLAGNVEMWDMKKKKLISNPQAPDSSLFEWAPDGIHWMTATCAPRLRVGNGLKNVYTQLTLRGLNVVAVEDSKNRTKWKYYRFKVWHYTGTLMYESSIPADQELWEARWQPAPDTAFPEPRISYKPMEAAEGAPKQPPAAPKRYVPPALRGLPEAQQVAQGPKYREEFEKPSNLKQQQQPEVLSKQALKNKKKREAKKAKAQAGEPATPTPVPQSPAAQQAPAPQSSAAQQAPAPQSQASAADGGSGENDKKIRSVKKKLKQIENLKQKKAAGETLEKNQLEKLTTEPALLQELRALSL